LRQNDATAAAGRDRLNITLPGLIDAAPAATTDRRLALDALQAAIADVGSWDSGAGQRESDLLARDDQGRLHELANLGDCPSNALELLDELEEERHTHLAQAAALLAAIDALPALPYVASPTLPEQQLPAARAPYGDDPTVLEADQCVPG